jgi:hypothetical protein
VKAPRKFILVMLSICVAGFGFLGRGGSAPVAVTISRITPFVLSWPTNIPSFAVQTTTNPAGGPWVEWPVAPSIVGTNYVVTNTFSGSSRLFRLSNKPQLECLGQLKQIGLAFRVWALDAGDRYPFETRTILGGTRELRAIGPDGFDTNSWMHFQVMSNEIYYPSILVCPGDLSRKAADNFQILASTNVTYRLRTGDDVFHTNDIMGVCPIDGNILFYDGTAIKGTNY